MVCCVKSSREGHLSENMGVGAFQDIGQLVASSAGAVVRNRLKLSVEEAHELVKCEMLLQLQVTFSHSARLHLTTHFPN